VDTELLVDSRIDDGQRLIDQLVRDGLEIKAAFWVKTKEEGLWHLYIASPSVDQEKPGEAYGRAYASLSELPDTTISLSDIKLINGTNPLAKAAVAVRERQPGKGLISVTGKRLGDQSIEEAYVYPPPGKWFKGFDEIKRHFPSAEVFSIPILWEDMRLVETSALMGRINAAGFEGKEPGTVIYVGPQGSSGRPLGELVFVHRPEGWNTLFRPDTGRWEEVVHGETGKKLYESADFSTLAALKTPRKPHEDQIEQMKKRLAEGWVLTMPPDTTPISSIPFTPPTRPGEAPKPPIDWEDIRRHLEDGGRIHLQGPSRKEGNDS
jgi:hypothetical protein